MRCRNRSVGNVNGSPSNRTADRVGVNGSLGCAAEAAEQRIGPTQQAGTIGRALQRQVERLHVYRPPPLRQPEAQRRLLLHLAIAADDRLGHAAQRYLGCETLLQQVGEFVGVFDVMR